ncbi:MAG: hypothetical protein AAGE18_18295 [Pseudomonadota bacterium]
MVDRTVAIDPGIEPFPWKGGDVVRLARLHGRALSVFTRLLPRCQFIKAPAGTVVQRAGVVPKAALYLMDGRALVQGLGLVDPLAPGHLIGAEAALAGRPATFHLVAEAEAQFAAWRPEDLRTLLAVAKPARVAPAPAVLPAG